MSTYVLMRILESAPHRYDLGIRLATFGVVDKAYERLASRVEPGQRVLDIGCGTGALALRAARRGARVRGIDVNPAMLEIAAQHARDEGLESRVEWAEIGVAELRREAPGSYDVVSSGLCFSELSQDELRYALAEARRLLRPGGLLLVADEVRPRNPVIRILLGILRAPLLFLTVLLTQRSSHAVVGLEEELQRADFQVLSRRSSGLQTFLEVVARSPEATP